MLTMTTYKNPLTASGRVGTRTKTRGRRPRASGHHKGGMMALMRRGGSRETYPLLGLMTVLMPALQVPTTVPLTRKGETGKCS